LPQENTTSGGLTVLQGGTGHKKPTYVLKKTERTETKQVKGLEGMTPGPVGEKVIL